MRIQGAWGPFEAAYVRALVINEEVGIRGVVRFLIDSGASRTNILDSDAERLALDYDQLEEFAPGTTGIGGTVETFILPDMRLIFRTAAGFHEERLSQLFGLRHVIHEPEVAERIKKLPSLLGRDIRNKYRVILDWTRNLVVITAERRGMVSSTGDTRCNNK